MYHFPAFRILLPILFLLFNQSLATSSSKPVTSLETKTHTNIKSFYENLAEFNHECLTKFKPKVCGLLHPKSRKFTKIHNSNPMKWYILDNVNHTISMDDYFGQNPWKNCQELLKLKENSIHGNFLTQEIAYFCPFHRYNEREDAQEGNFQHSMHERKVKNQNILHPKI